MNKKELCKELSERLGCTQIDANKFIDTLRDVVIDTCSEGDKVAINGFVTFERVDKDARMVMNPKTGEHVTTKAKSIIKSKMSKTIEL